jgi:hypothetical protein
MFNGFPAKPRWVDASRTSAAAVEPLECRQLLAATPYVTAGSGTTEGGSATFTVGVRLGYMDPVSPTERVYGVEIATSGTATAEADFQTPGSVIVVIPPNERVGTATLTIPTYRDNHVEGSETLIVRTPRISGPGAAGTLNDPVPSATVTIGDDPPRVSFADGNSWWPEAEGVTYLTLRRAGGDVTQALEAGITFAGPAARGEEYEAPDSVAFAPDAAETKLRIESLDDDEREAPVGNETWSEDAIFGIAPGGGAYIASEQTVNIAFRDDATWGYDRWRLVKKPLEFAAELVKGPDEQSPEPGVTVIDTWFLCQEWRYLGITDTSNGFGDAADITGRSVTFTTERTVGGGGSIDVDLEAIGAPLSIGGAGAGGYDVRDVVSEVRPWDESRPHWRYPHLGGRVHPR